MAKKQMMDWAGDTVKITYGNGAMLELDCTTLPDGIYVPCAASRHGIGQKLGDAKSGGTAAEKYAEAMLIVQSLRAGDWNRRGTGEGVNALMPDVFKLLAEGQPDPEAAAEDWLAKYGKLTEEQQLELRKKPHMKAAIDKVKADRRLAGVETEEEEFDPFV